MKSTPSDCIATDCTGNPADGMAERIATQAANYYRHVRAGGRHDASEIASLLAEVRALHNELTGHPGRTL